MKYTPPAWLPGGNLQTIYAARLAQTFVGAAPVYRRERWTTPDADFIDLDWLADESPSDKPLVVLFHGLEGSIHSPYAAAMMATIHRRGWRGVLMHFRG